jgi:hypothetical protein
MFWGLLRFNHGAPTQAGSIEPARGVLTRDRDVAYQIALTRVKRNSILCSQPLAAENEPSVDFNGRSGCPAGEMGCD